MGSLPSKVTLTAETQRERSPRLGLDQGDVVGGHRLRELGLPPLAGRVGHEGAGDPRGVEVVVDGAVGPVLGRVGHRVAVAAGRDGHGADIGGHVFGSMVDPGEELDGAVAGIRLGRVLAGRLGGPGVGLSVSHRKACLRLVSVTTSWAPGRASSWMRADCPWQGARVVDGALGVEQPEPGHVVEPGGVARHHQGAGVRLGPQDRAGIRHGVGHQGAGPGQVARERPGPARSGWRRWSRWAGACRRTGGRSARAGSPRAGGPAAGAGGCRSARSAGRTRP